MSEVTLTDKISDEMILSLVHNCKKDVLIDDMYSEMITNIRQYEKLGIVVAAVRANDTLAIGGVGRVHTGVGVAWIVINKDFLKYPKDLLKVNRYIINEALSNMDLHRIQIDIDISFEENIRFAKRLGFMYEGTMYQYGPNRQDYHRYALIRKD